MFRAIFWLRSLCLCNSMCIIRITTLEHCPSQLVGIFCEGCPERTDKATSSRLHIRVGLQCNVMRSNDQSFVYFFVLARQLALDAPGQVSLQRSPTEGSTFSPVHRHVGFHSLCFCVRVCVILMMSKAHSWDSDSLPNGMLSPCYSSSFLPTCLLACLLAYVQVSSSSL